MRLKNASDLLLQLARGLRPFDRMRLACIEVIIIGTDGTEYEFGLDDALEVLANDLFFDERGNWADAEKLLVRSI